MWGNFLNFFADLGKLIKKERSYLKIWRILSFFWIERYSGPHGSAKKGEKSGDTNTEQENRWCWQQKVEENWSGCWKEQLRIKALVLEKEKSLHHGGGWCHTHGNVLQGLRGAVGRSGSRLGAAHRHQSSRSGWHGCVSPSSLWKSNCCLLTLKLPLTPCFFSLHVGIEPCHFKLVSYLSIADVV